MSGPICPDCGMFDIKIEDKKNSCRFCGWEGRPLPRKILSSEMLRDYGHRQRELRKKREECKLFFIRIYINNEDNVELDKQIMELLDLDTLDGPKEEGSYYFIELDHKPTEEQIKKIKSFKEVIDIKVF